MHVLPGKDTTQTGNCWTENLEEIVAITCHATFDGIMAQAFS